MIQYRLDPAKPRQLTDDERRRLDKARIDYSDIPPLDTEFYARARAMTDEPDLPFRGEEYLNALLLDLVMEHCGGFSPEKRRTMTSFLAPDPMPGHWLDSYGSPANAAAMRELSYSGEIEIVEQDGAHIIAKLTPKGRVLLDQLRADQQRERG
jgi:hypothetical protein